MACEGRKGGGAAVRGRSRPRATLGAEMLTRSCRARAKQAAHVGTVPGSCPGRGPSGGGLSVRWGACRAGRGGGRMTACGGGHAPGGKGGRGCRTRGMRSQPGAPSWGLRPGMRTAGGRPREQGSRQEVVRSGGRDRAWKRAPQGPRARKVRRGQRFQGVMAHLMQSSCRCSKIR